jgi:hypothetical protein
MKKVMFIIFAMLFSVSVSAATLDLDKIDASFDSQEGGGVTGDLSDTVTALGYTTQDDGEYIQDWAISTDAETSILVEVNFNPEDTGTSISLWSGGSILSSAIGGDPMSFIYNGLMTGTDYFIRVVGTVNGDLNSYNLTVSNVPVPAALFLFAPALLGLFGLRRKAVLAAQD